MSDTKQTTYDWSNDSQECVEGLKLDHDTEYEFILEGFSKHDMKTKDGTIITYKKGPSEGEPVLMYTFEWKMIETNIVIKDDYFVKDKYRVNENSPELEDDIVKVSRKLGYNPVLGGKFSVADFVQIGMKIKARLKYRAPTKAGERLDEERGVIVTESGAEKKAFDAIDIDTIVLDGESSGGDSQQEIPEEIPAATIKEVQDLIKAGKCKKFADLATQINKFVKTNPEKHKALLSAAMNLNQQGKLKF